MVLRKRHQETSSVTSASVALNYLFSLSAVGVSEHFTSYNGGSPYWLAMHGRTYHRVFSTDSTRHEHPAQWLLYDSSRRDAAAANRKVPFLWFAEFETDMEDAYIELADPGTGNEIVALFHLGNAPYPTPRSLYVQRAYDALPTPAFSPASSSIACLHFIGTAIDINDGTFTIDSGYWSTESTTVVHFKAAITFPDTKRWERMNAPNLGSSASIRATFNGVDADLNFHHEVVELTYLRAVPLASTPRKAAAASQPAAGSPTPGNPWKRRVTLMVGAESEGEQSPTPAKRRRITAPSPKLPPPPILISSASSSSSSPATPLQTPNPNPLLTPPPTGLEPPSTGIIAKRNALPTATETPTPPTKSMRPRRSTRKM